MRLSMSNLSASYSVESSALVDYFPPSKMYPLGLGIGPRHVPVRVRIRLE